MDEQNLPTINLKTICWILWSSVISSFVIMLIHNSNLDGYLKYITFPCCILLINFGLIVSYLKQAVNTKAFVWLIPIILILISFPLLEVDESNLMINVFMLPVLISIFFFSLINKNYCLSRNFVVWIFKLFPGYFSDNIELMRGLKTNKVGEKSDKRKNIIIGICIGVPIALVLLNLLASADKYFGALMESITSVFSNVPDLGFVVENFMIFGFAFLVCYTTLTNVIRHQRTKDNLPRLYEMNADISKTVLCIVNGVFVLFLVSEISKITVNFLSLPIEYTYAEYAREGFFQLLFVTVINFVIILYYLYFEKIGKDNGMIKKLLMLLIGFSILLIFNSYYRMFLYIGNYGFTVLRLQVILFLFMELILFGVMFKKLIWDLKNKDAYIFATLIITTYIVNLYFCIQPFIDLLN